MNYRTCGALLLCTFPSLALAGEAPKPATDPIVGTWRGFHTVNGVGHQHYIDVRKQGNAYGGVGLLWYGITEDQAKAASRGGKPAGDIFAKAFCVQQNYTIQVQGDTITFRGVSAQGLFKITKYECDIFSGKLNASAVGGEAADAKKKAGTFQLAREDLFKNPPKLELEKGKTQQGVACLEGGNYHYSVYIPKAYDPSKPWPLLLNFSPGGNAEPLNAAVADEVGWIMVGLTESKNGPWDPICENRDAVLFDVRRRFNVDWKRVYFSGFSGGARAASSSANAYPGICAGLILVGAAYGDAPPLKDVPIFYLAGQTDMNNAEVRGAFDTAKRAGRKCNLIIHPGGHSWGRDEDHAAAIRWLEQETGGKKAPEPPKAK